MDDWLGLFSNIIEAWTPTLCGIIYIMALLYARHIWIIRRNVAHLDAYDHMIQVQLETEQRNPAKEDNIEKKVIPEIKRLLELARKQGVNGHDKKSKSKCGNLSPEGIGQQLAAWRLLHDADRLATDLWSADQVAAKAVVVKEELKGLDTAAAKELSEAIAKTMKQNASKHLRPLVKEARGMLFNERDNYFERLSDLQNKALWLVIVATGFIILIATSQQSIYLLLGAIGGLLSRMRTTLNAGKKEFDYGVSWSILFLAPLIGALTGWAGVLVSTFVVEIDVLKLPENLLDSTKCVAGTPKMVLAFIFGFSATLFDRVLTGTEEILTKKPATGDGANN